MSLILVALFLALLAVGVPIAVCLGLSSAVVIVMQGLPVAVLSQRSLNALDSSPLLAVPLFILAANLLNATGVTTHLFDLVRMIFGRIRGAVAQVSVFVSLIFSGISGAALADIGALGAIQINQMKAQGYREEFAAGVTVAAATIGPIFPPSIPIIIYASVANVSAVKLLLAGIIPALLLTGLLMAQIAIIARVKGLPRDTVRAEPKAIARKAVISIPALLAPVLLIGGLMSGWFGPTEVAGVTVAYATLIGIVVYRSLTLRKMGAALRETVESTANILFVVATAALFAWVLTLDQVPMKVSGFLLGLSENPLVLLLIVNVFLLIVGMVLESIAAILIIAPIVAPALTAAGVDPLQLGIVFVLNLMIGLLTPPVGMSLYMITIITKMPINRVIAGVLPFFIPLLLSLLVVSAVPALSTWLPETLMN
ncbi:MULTISPECIES: TRAP transporter large permease [Mameliella]|uniref:TRAP transporter large permease n=1 Tax=Mameliella TaxID=1434019 RepID=UPI0008411CBE|nr:MULTISPECIES: TRAP transporter large permease [Mameliella]ODM48995.1 ABC transporter permease [Ruegeria sp. PBVC088]MBY6118264.1 TRAP transporter large permease [Mameliella alba]MDD9732236.1 TRAP transporter large permease [Mameliella sp. AT18]OWV43452.1 ABC transporter permease [Mameliella alba]OWV68589.1 ABC transporter permease [Mameliella alba]